MNANTIFPIILLNSLLFVGAFSANAQVSHEIQADRNTTRGLSEAETAYQKGEASYYAERFEGQKTASGETYRREAFTGAHPTLPFGTKVRVTNLSNNLTVVIRINDRGPHKAGRVIDLSYAAAEEIGIIRTGVAQVKLEVQQERSILPNPNMPERGVTKPYVSRETGQTAAQTDKVIKPSGKGLFKIAAELPEGLGIQIAAYTDERMMMDRVEYLEKKGMKNVLVQLGTSSSGTPIYRILSGPFQSNAEAQTNLEKLKTLGEDGIILHMKNLK